MNPGFDINSLAGCSNLNESNATSGVVHGFPLPGPGPGSGPQAVPQSSSVPPSPISIPTAALGQQPPLSMPPQQSMGTMGGPAMSVPTNVLNTWASSVNLSSIQSLVDVLLELPLPSEIELPSQNQPLISVNQEQQHLSNNIEQELVQQHHLSHQLSSCLLQARQQLNELNLNWISSPVNEGNQEFSQNLQVNSYLLSLLQRQDIFGEDVRLPPVIHAQPSVSSCVSSSQPQQHPQSSHHQQQQQPQQQPQQQQQQQQHQQQQQQQQPPPQQPLLLPPPTPTTPSAQIGPQTRSHSYPYWNPFINEQQSAQSPASGAPNQQQPYSRHPNQMYSNENSNSSGSFPDIGSAAPGTPSAPPNHNSAKIKSQSYNEMAGKHPQGVVLESPDMNNTSSYSPTSFESFTSLGERVKKRQRNNLPTPTPPANATPVKEPSSSTITPSSSSVQNERTVHQSEEIITPPPRKLSKSLSSANVKSFHTMSSSSTSPRLVSSSSSAPAPEKFEAMLDELFDMDNVKKPAASSDESSDSEDDGRKRKTQKKTNGDNSTSNKSLLFDITLSSTTLTTFVCLAAKLKRINAMQNIPVEKLGKILNVLNQQLAIQSAGLKDKRRKSTDTGDPNAEDDEEESIANSASLMSKFEMCCDCCLLALYIMTSKGMSSRVYLEECIEHIIAFLNTTIQQYTTIGGAPSMFASPKKGGKSPKKSSNSCVSPFSSANKKLLYKMYVKWSELIGCLVELLNARAGTLTDTLVLSATRVALGAFFLENLNASGSNQSSNEIQLNALNLTTTIFSQYHAHRPVILEEILHSIARVSTCKRGRVLYKVESDDKSAAYISMFSALLLRLIQSLFLPERRKEDKTNEINEAGDSKDKEKEKVIDRSKEKQDQSQILRKQYDSALLTALSFLTTFLKKCHGSSGGGSASSSDADFRVIFENLVNDLMVTLFKPNWPASQMLTKVLMRMFLNNVKATNKSPAKGSGSGNMSANLNMKLHSLDHLGNICSRYAKELNSVEKVKLDVQTRLRNLLSGGGIEMNARQNSDDEEDADDEKRRKDDEDKVKSDGEGNDSGDEESRKSNKNKNKDKKKKNSKKKEDRLLNDNILVREMWKHLFRYCDEEKLLEEKNLFTASFIKEMDREMELKIKDDQYEEDKIRENFNLRVKKFMDIYKTASNQNASEEEYHVIDSRTAEQIIRYLDNSLSSTEKLFDVALAHIVSTLSGTSNTTMRSRAMKALSTILNNAPKKRAITLLSRPDVQRATRAALLDTSTSVREATIDLIGKFILNGQSEELIDKYYEILTERILDAGVSVRKRVIKILREICIVYPSYKRVPEICSKIIKRINDDGEGIRKLVTETFTTMWFKEEKDKEAAKMKVKCINHVVATVITERIGTEWLQQLLTNLFSSGPDGKIKKNVMDDDDDEKTTPSAAQLQQVIAASAQIVDVLVSDVLCGSGPNSDDPQASLDNNSKSTCFATMTTIWLFSKVCPQLLVNHISILQPYLSVKITSELDSLILIKAVQIIEHVLPKLTNPSDLLLSSIEEGLTKIILQSNPQVLVVCVSCLSSLIHKHTNNKQLAQDLFKRFFSLLDSLYRLPQSDFNSPINRPRLLRALFTCGLFAKHFEFLAEKQQLYQLFVQFVARNMPSEENGYKVGDLSIINNALSGLGFMFERNPAYTLQMQTQDIYKSILSAALNISDCKPLETYYESTMISVLKNLTNYLSDELNAEIAKTLDWSKENLKTMSYEDSEEGDSNSIQSSIIQTYLPDIVKCTLCPLTSVRKAAVNLIHIIHRGGIVHPLQLVPYLIAMSSDDDTSIRSRADHVLHEIERKYHGFVSMKARQGVQLSFQLHNFSGRRGYRIENIMQSSPANVSSPNSSSFAASSNQPAPEDQLITGRLSTLYSVIASNRQSRRAFITGLLKYFDLMSEPHSFFSYDPMSVGIINLFDGNNAGIDLVPLQQYVSDNLIWLPYSVLDEPLYILSQLEVNISVTASQIQAQFKDLLNLSHDYDDEDEEGNQKFVKKEEHKPDVTRMDENGKNYGEDEANEEKLNSLEMKMDISMASATSESDMRLDMSTEPKTENGFVNPLPVSSKDFISSAAVAELIRCLKAFYMLCWCKQMIRELFNITDAKFQDYSPSENQKVWDKQMHRRHVDPRLLQKLMAYPAVNIDLENFTRETILLEYQRFKNLQLTGFDETCKNVAILLKEPLPKEKKEKEKSSRSNRNRIEEEDDEEDEEPSIEEEEEKIPVVSSSYNHQADLGLPKLSEEEKEKLIEQIKMSDCQVKLIDINASMNSNQITMNSNNTDESDARTGLKMTISTANMNSHSADKIRSSCKKKKKKHKKYSD